MTARLSRRGFLALVGLAAVGGAIAGGRLLGGGRDQTPERRPDAAGTAEALFDDRGAARRVGDAYLEGRPDERSKQRLVRLVSDSSAELGRALRTGDLDSLRTLAGRRAAREFAHGRLVTLDGWLLAPIEARLAALATYA